MRGYPQFSFWILFGLTTPREGLFSDNEINNLNEHNNFKNPNWRGGRPVGYLEAWPMS